MLIAAGLMIEREAAIRSAETRGYARGFIGDVPVDLFVNSIRLHTEAAQRTVRVELFNRPLNILSAEDLVALKVLF